MSQLKGRIPFAYLYVDDEGIESLFAQTTDRVETELTESRSKEGQGVYFCLRARERQWPRTAV
jgi:hypothetical protein